MKQKYIGTIFCILVFLLLLYFQVIFFERFSDEDRKCIRREWKENTFLPHTRDHGSNYSIIFSDVHKTFNWVHLPTPSTLNPDIILIVTSRCDNFGKRNILRKTWMKQGNSRIRSLFLVGLGGTVDGKMREIVMREAELYGDMVVTDLEDTYVGLPFKSLSLLLYAVSKEPSSKLIAKIDEDVIFFPNQLIGLINEKVIKLTGLNIYGYVVEAGIEVDAQSEVLKTTSFNCQKYPEFLAGPIYFLTRDAAKEILKATKHRNLLISEDTLITGILADDTKTTRHQLPYLNPYQNAEIQKSEKILAWHTKLENDKFLNFFESYGSL